MKKSLILVVALLVGVFALAQADQEKEVANKADFIISLIDNVEWPKDSESESGDEIVIHVIGDTPMLAKLEELAELKSQKGPKVSVEQVKYTDDLSGCDFLFVSSEDLSVLAKVLKKVNGTKTLTIADAKDFARYGVMINFFEEEGSSRVRYEVNKLVVDSAGITISSKVMDKAELI